MDAREEERLPELLDLVSRERWQKLQAHFARVLGMGLRTLSPASKSQITESSWPAGIDADEQTELLAIGDELEELFPSPEAIPQVTTATTRPLGHSFAAVPLRANPDLIVGYLVVGPVILGPREEFESFRSRLMLHGAEGERIWKLLQALKTYTYGSFKSVLSMLEEVGNAVLELSYQSKELKKILPTVDKIDQLVTKHYTGRLWHSLLDIACAATKAQGGSIMLFEPATQSFKIAAALGLPDDVIKTPRISAAGNIADVAIKRRQILRIDNDVRDPEIMTRMRRPEITSSLVAPFTSSTDLSGEPVGVLNLRTMDYGSRFSAEDIEVLRKLIQLAQTVFSTLKFFPETNERVLG